MGFRWSAFYTGRCVARHEHRRPYVGFRTACGVSIWAGWAYQHLLEIVERLRPLPWAILEPAHDMKSYPDKRGEDDTFQGAFR